VVPIEDTIVEAKLDTVFFACLVEFSQKVPILERCAGGIEVGEFTVPKAESVVVLRCDDQILHAGRFGCAGDEVGIELRRVEILRDLGIRLIGNSFRRQSGT
jgi:hypothetical protein